MTVAITDIRTDVREDAKLLLERAWDAAGEIESQAGEIADAMVELLSLENLPDDVESLADDIGAETWELANALGDRLNRLRKEIADWAADYGDEAA